MNLQNYIQPTRFENYKKSIAKQELEIKNLKNTSYYRLTKYLIIMWGIIYFLYICVYVCVFTKFMKRDLEWRILESRREANGPVVIDGRWGDLIGEGGARSYWRRCRIKKFSLSLSHTQQTNSLSLSKAWSWVWCGLERKYLYPSPRSV